MSDGGEIMHPTNTRPASNTMSHWYRVWPNHSASRRRVAPTLTRRSELWAFRMSFTVVVMRELLELLGVGFRVRDRLRFCRPEQCVDDLLMILNTLFVKICKRTREQVLRS